MSQGASILQYFYVIQNFMNLFSKFSLIYQQFYFTFYCMHFVQFYQRPLT